MQKHSKPCFKAFLILCLGLATFVMHCSNSKVLQKNNLKKGQTVALRMSSGERVTGVIIKSTETDFVIRDNKGQAWKAPKNRIVSATGPEPVYDLSGHVIPELQIKAARHRKNMLLFSISGGLLSMGTSFFLSSMVSRSQGDDDHDAVIYGGTAAGTILGTFWFSRIGLAKDRKEAIKTIREERYQESVLEEQERKEQLEKEINRLQKQIEEKK